LMKSFEGNSDDNQLITEDERKKITIIAANKMNKDPRPLKAGNWPANPAQPGNIYFNPDQLQPTSGFRQDPLSMMDKIVGLDSFSGHSIPKAPQYFQNAKLLISPVSNVAYQTPSQVRAPVANVAYQNPSQMRAPVANVAYQNPSQMRAPVANIAYQNPSRRRAPVANIAYQNPSRRRAAVTNIAYQNPSQMRAPVANVAYRNPSRMKAPVANVAYRNPSQMRADVFRVRKPAYQNNLQFGNSLNEISKCENQILRLLRAALDLKPQKHVKNQVVFRKKTTPPPMIMQKTGVKSAIYFMYFVDELFVDLQRMMNVHPQGVVVKFQANNDVFVVCIKLGHHAACECMSATGKELPREFFGSSMEFVRAFRPEITTAEQLQKQLLKDLHDQQICKLNSSVDSLSNLARPLPSALVGQPLDISNPLVSHLNLPPLNLANSLISRQLMPSNQHLPPVTHVAPPSTLKKLICKKIRHAPSPARGDLTLFTFDPSDLPKARDTKSAVMQSRSRFRLFCSHCRTVFWAKPTKRQKKFVVNHRCPGLKKRRQFVIGSYHRKCQYEHSTPCVFHLPCSPC